MRQIHRPQLRRLIARLQVLFAEPFQRTHSGFVATDPASSLPRNAAFALGFGSGLFHFVVRHGFYVARASLSTPLIRVEQRR
jgi:hypothetical protein